MKRRSFLATASIGLLGGCTFGTGNETPTETPTATATPVPSAEPTATPGSTESAEPDEQSLAERLRAANEVVDFETADLTAAIPASRSGNRTRSGLVTRYALVEPATADSPAVVWATVENTRRFERSFRTGRIPGFERTPSGRYVDSGGRTADAYLAPTENHEDIGYSVAVTRDDAGRWRLGTEPGDWLPGRLTLSPDETRFGEYHLVAPHDTEAPPISAGRYDFSAEAVGFSLSVWPTDALGPSEESVFENPDVPPLPVDGPTEWFHEADEDTEVYLFPSAERVSTPARVEFGLRNRSRERLEGNPLDWGFYKLRAGTWHRIAPFDIPQPLGYVQPGETERSALGLYHGEPVPGDDVRTVGHLGGGRYAYYAGYRHEDERYAALLDVEAPPVSPEPTEAVDIERDGNEVVVYTPRWKDDDTERYLRYVFERTDRDPERRLVAEQLFRVEFLGYRNTLPLFEPDVERVVLRVDDGTIAHTSGYDDLGGVVAYDGDTYRVESTAFYNT